MSKFKFGGSMVKNEEMNRYKIRATMVARQSVDIELDEQEYKEWCKYGCLPYEAERAIDETLYTCGDDIEWECEDVKEI